MVVTPVEKPKDVLEDLNDIGRKIAAGIPVKRHELVAIIERARVHIIDLRNTRTDLMISNLDMQIAQRDKRRKK